MIPSTTRTAVASSLRGYWRDAARYQRLAYLTALVLVGVGLAHLVGFALLGGPWLGPVAWRKPFAFGLSFGMTLATLAWIAGFLAPGRRAGWALCGVLAAACTLEVIWVSVQRARGVASHFNDATALDAALFYTAGVAAAAIVAVIVTLAGLAFVGARCERPLVWAIRTGLVVLVLSMAVGVLMIKQGGSPAGAGMKVPHAVGMHAIQVLPALACVGYLGLMGVVALQTVAGLAPWDLTAVTWVLLMTSVGLLVAGYLAAGVALRGSFRAADHRSRTAGTRTG